MSTKRVLIAGESWVTHSIHEKGVGPLKAALEAGDFCEDYLPNHVAATDFPDRVEALGQQLLAWFAWAA